MSEENPSNEQNPEQVPEQENEEMWNEKIVQEQKNYKPANPGIKECIQLNQLLPISQIDNNIDAISSIIYEYDDLLNEFLQKVDNRTIISNDDPKGDFIKCEQNRDGDSYRSPISNQYYPPIDDARYPSNTWRKLEEQLNKIFKLYINNYYTPTTHFSCYCWDLGNSPSEGFGVSVLIKNSISHEQGMQTAVWDSSNIITVTFEGSGTNLKAKYHLITSVNLSLGFENKTCGKVNWSGAWTRSSKSHKVVKAYHDEAHIEAIGVLIEDLESSMRSTIEIISVMKTKEIIDTARFNPIMGKPGIEQSQALKNVMKGGQ